MKIALFGGSEFVGNYIIQELIREGFIPWVLVRKPSASKITSPCELIYGDIQDKYSIIETIKGADAVILSIIR